MPSHSHATEVPDYRDRLVDISQCDNEGGLNPDMPHDVVMRLSDRGMHLHAIVRRFGETAQLGAASVLRS
jgi:hypothetical protein